MRLNVSCLQIMMKRPHSCASAAGPHRISRHATRYLWIKLPRGRGGGRVAATTTPATRVICYFALSATRSLIKRPLRVVRPRHFSSPAATYDMPRLALYSNLFFLHLHFWPFFCLATPFSPRVSRTNAPRRPGEFESDGISSKPLHELPGDSLLWEKFVLLRREIQILFYKGTFFNMHRVNIWKKYKFLIFDRATQMLARMRIVFLFFYCVTLSTDYFYKKFSFLNIQRWIYFMKHNSG